VFYKVKAKLFNRLMICKVQVQLYQEFRDVQNIGSPISRSWGFVKFRLNYVMRLVICKVQLFQKVDDFEKYMFNFYCVLAARHKVIWDRGRIFCHFPWRCDCSVLSFNGTPMSIVGHCTESWLYRTMSFVTRT
jgi:hypothetical protein